MAFSALTVALRWSVGEAKKFFGKGDASAQVSAPSRIGLGLSGGLLILAGLWMLVVEPTLVLGEALSVGLLAFGLFNIISSLKKSLVIYRANQLSLVGHLVALITFYLVLSRLLMVGYSTDTIVGTYMGVLKVLQLQSPYPFSIKPLLDQFGFSPSFYTPGVDGSFDFHLAYPSLSFLSVLPFYVIGVHDVRDVVFIFHILSVLVIFGVAPARLKSVSLAPFSLFSFVIAGSWTDSVWAFFLVLTAFLWYRHPKTSWVTLGLSIAVKQIAIVIAPFLLIRLWHERGELQPRTLATASGLMLAAFFLPNLPFILASPNAWWADTVAPYLPNAPSQVPGGIGLSNFLLDLGIALPSSFFIVLMLGASGSLLYLYARHYRGLNSLVFAFPILLFFFYYRSFPNYMAYWLFPLVLELCTLGGPNFKIVSILRVPSIAWRPPTGTFLRVFRQKLTPTVLVILVLTLAFVGVSGAYISQAANPKASIQVNSVMDPDSIGAVTMINVTLRNLLSTPISPNFFVKYGPLPFLWTTNSTGLINGYSTNSYVISAPDALSAIPHGYPFHIVIFDKVTGQLLGESSSWKADIVAPSLVNPGLKWWVLDQSVGKKVPFGWKLALSNTDVTTSRVEPLGVNGASGISMALNYTSNSGLVAQLALSQRMLLNATNVSIHLNQSLATNISTKTLVGASITDGTHTLYYLFSDLASHQTITPYSTNVTIIVPTQRSQWSTITITPQTIWSNQGWAIPQIVTLTVFLESNSAGVYYANVDEITPVQ
jgi:hypothetical protein